LVQSDYPKIPQGEIIFGIFIMSQSELLKQKKHLALLLQDAIMVKKNAYFPGLSPLFRHLLA
jgi:hypothetical protein